jgi:tRNA threonylcarbamoyladenosine biosynthesis protein TsaE
MINYNNLIMSTSKITPIPQSLFDDLDLESYLATSITVVEWGEGLADRLAEDYLEVKIEFGEGENQRLLSIQSHGSRFESLKL